MKSKDINKLNKQTYIPNKTNKYCNKCSQIYNVSDYVSKCPICKTKLTACNHSPEPNVPKCPTCGSTNIKRISSLSRATHGFAFGLLSKTARSQFECKNCRYKW